MNAQENNLRKLSAYLRTTQEAFDMKWFAMKDSKSVEPVMPDGSWNDYYWTVFGIIGDSLVWLFAGNWCAVDNTPTGAADRIDYYLANGVPEDFDWPQAKWLEVYSK